jgi:hypothetical protein
MDMMYLEPRRTPLLQLGLSAKVRQCILADGIRTDDHGQRRIGTIQDLIECSARELMRTPNFGPKALEEVRDKLGERRLALRGETPQDSRLNAPLIPASTLAERLDDMDRKLELILAALVEHHD